MGRRILSPVNVVRRSLLALSGALLLLGVGIVVGTALGFEINPFEAGPESVEANLLTGAALLGTGLCLLPSACPRKGEDAEDEAEDGVGW